MNGLPYRPLREGDRFTIGGTYKTQPNPAARWWAWWRPKVIRTQELQEFVVHRTEGGTWLR